MSRYIPAALDVQTWLAERAGIIGALELTPGTPAHLAAGVEALDQLATIFAKWATTYPSEHAAQAAQRLADARTPADKLAALEHIARVRDAVTQWSR